MLIMTDENERFLLTMKDKLGEHDYERLQNIMMEEALDYKNVRKAHSFRCGMDSTKIKNNVYVVKQLKSM